jgi:hypothetical protein
MRIYFYLCVGLALLSAPDTAAASFINVQQSEVAPITATITLDEVPIGSYGAIPYLVSSGPFAGGEIIFGSYFQGQTPQGVDPVTISEPTAPGQPLQLLYDINDYIQVTDDAASPSSPVLAGGPLTFRQPISIQFSTPVAAVGLTAGFLDAIGSLSIAAYDADGNELGVISNDALGYEQFGLLDPSGAHISGLTIEDSSPSGFGIDNVFLAVGVPEPITSLGGLLTGLVGLGFLSRRRGLAIPS